MHEGLCVPGGPIARTQEPLTVEDGSNVWIVRGAIEMKPNSAPGDPTRIEMSISKLDGAIVSFFG